MRRTRALSGLAVVSALLLAVPCAEGAEPMIGASAPAFELPSLQGDHVALADMRGKLVVLHFGAGW